MKQEEKHIRATRGAAGGNGKAPMIFRKGSVSRPRFTPRCDVALLVDEETGEHRPSGRFVPESDDVEEKVLRALRKRYRRVEVVPFLPSVTHTIERLRNLRPRIVFNLTEWLAGDRKLDAAIA